MRVAQKMYNFAPGAINHTFFRLTLYLLCVTYFSMILPVKRAIFDDSKHHQAVRSDVMNLDL